MRSENAAILLSFVALTVLTAVLLAPISWPVGMIFWIIIVMFLLIAVVAWHSRVTSYACPDCGNTFTISAFRDFISPHGTGSGGWKCLRCPRCGKMVRAASGEKQQQ